MSTPSTRRPSLSLSPRRLSVDTWAILLAAALGLLIRFGLLKTIAWEPMDPRRGSWDQAPGAILRGIPSAAFDYRLGNRSAFEWVIDQYRVSTDPRSGITNDPTTKTTNATSSAS
jgi:hypothetical protein